MRFKIVYDTAGRIRLRYGTYAFEQNIETAISAYFNSDPAIIKADANSVNGSVLIYYKNGCRSNVIALAKSINFKTIEPLKDDSYTVKGIEHIFKEQFGKIIAKRIALKLFLPGPLMTAYTIYNGIKYIKRGLCTIANGKLTVDVLDGASIAACLVQKNYSTASSIMFMLSMSSLLEDYTRAKTKAALTESLAVKVDTVWLVKDNTQVQIPMSNLQIGDEIIVRTGSTIPVDGTITKGEAYINESSMTGEPLAVMKTTDASVFAGTVVEEGSINIKVRALSSDTKIQKIIELIDNSENYKAGIQSKAETIADKIVPLSFLGFGLTLLFTRNITKAVSILMVDYSCAIKLSTPISVISAIKEAADRGITVKGGKYLEEFAAANSIVFDKTGTLTNAEPVLEKVIPFAGYEEDKVLQISACLEEHFPHSVARAIVKGAEVKGINHLEEHAEVQYIVAHGIASTLHGEKVIIGSRHFVVDDENIEITPEQDKLIDKESGACSVVYLAIGGTLAGALCISDPPRKEAKEAVALLKDRGIDNIVMLTGDSCKAAKIISEKLGINNYHAQVLPEDKHSYIEELKKNGNKVIMVGDGINDAPALAAANVSVAMSDASDIAKETADITLRGADLTELSVLRDLSTKLVTRINSNYRFIVAFNSALLALGFFGFITPSTSAFMHNASTMAICAKSMTPLVKNKNQN